MSPAEHHNTGRHKNMFHTCEFITFEHDILGKTSRKDH